MMTNLELSNHPYFYERIHCSNVSPPHGCFWLSPVMERLYQMRREIQSERMVERTTLSFTIAVSGKEGRAKRLSPE